VSVMRKKLKSTSGHGIKLALKLVFLGHFETGIKMLWIFVDRFSRKIEIVS
jgi:hypothetical protein